MGKHHSDDYKETAINYYLTTNDSLRNTCVIFGCCHTSLTRWINKYKNENNIKRKQRNNKNIKVLPQIKSFILNPTPKIFIAIPIIRRITPIVIPIKNTLNDSERKTVIN